MKLITFLFFACWLVGSQVVAQDTLSTGTESKKNLSVVPLPAIYYTPETSLAMGAYVMNLFRLNPADTLTRASNLSVAAIYTLNKQLIFDVASTMLTNKERYMFRTKILYLKFPEYFYGIGNNTNKEDEELISYNRFNVRFLGMKKVAPHFFTGPQYEFQTIYNLTPADSGQIAQKNLVGSEGGINSGLSWFVLHDTRNRVINSSDGHFLEVSFGVYNKGLGGDFNYTNFRTDYRRFVNISKAQVLAIQGIANLQSGSPSFQSLGFLGGEQSMRGYYNGRFRDKSLLSSRMEYRFSFIESRSAILSRIGFVAFGALGTVADKPSNFDFGNIHASYGAGLRVMLNKSERLNIRIDYGFGKGSSFLYFNIGEVF